MALTLEYFYHQSQHKYRLQLLIPNARLDHQISWVHLVEDSNNSSFLRGNELIITTGLETAGNDQLLSFIKRLWERHVCGLILNMGPYIASVPKNVQEWCREHQFPLFSMPWEIHIADLMQDYCNEIISEKRTQDLRTEGFTRALDGDIREKDIPVLEGFRGCFLLIADQELSFAWYAQARKGNLFYYAATVVPNIPEHTFCGISEPISAPQSIRTQAKHASRALIVSHIRGKSKTHFRNIGLYNTVLAIEDQEVFDQMEQLLSPLEEPALRQTLRCWLEHDGSIQKVAEELFLHRNTVNYRIQKIRSLVSMDTAIQKTRLLLAFYMGDVRPYL